MRKSRLIKSRVFELRHCITNAKSYQGEWSLILCTVFEVCHTVMKSRLWNSLGESINIVFSVANLLFAPSCGRGSRLMACLAIAPPRHVNWVVEDIYNWRSKNLFIKVRRWRYLNWKKNPQKNRAFAILLYQWMEFTGKIRNVDILI